MLPSKILPRPKPVSSNRTLPPLSSLTRANKKRILRAGEMPESSGGLKMHIEQQPSSGPHIRPLREPITIYVDDSSESASAKRVLGEVGAHIVPTSGPVEPLNRKPLAIYLGGVYQGLEEITGLRDLLV